MPKTNSLPEEALSKTRIHPDDPLAATKFCWDLSSRVGNCGMKTDRDMVLLCIGTDRSTGDCLGPLVGSKIKELRHNTLHVFGTLEEPVHAGNLRETHEEIRKSLRDPFIIAVDACLGSMENVGWINVCDGSLLPGAGVNKNLPAVGDIHITGIVNVGGFLEYMVLQNTRLNMVMKLADLIVAGFERMFRETAPLKAV